MSARNCRTCQSCHLPTTVSGNRPATTPATATRSNTASAATCHHRHRGRGGEGGSSSSQGSASIAPPAKPLAASHSADQFLDDAGLLDAGEALVEAEVAVGQALVVDAHQLQH